MSELVVIALGGNAISPSGGTGSAAEQTRNLWSSMAQVADLVADGVDVVLTHGNGPQVGAILIKNEMARDVVPAVPLDWCVANTQATIGFVATTALEHHLRDRGVDRPVVSLVSRVRVDADDPAMAEPTKPVGPWFTEEQARARAAEDGHVYGPLGDRGWRRLVPSPQPRESLDLAAIRLLRDQGAIVIANGGGGIPMARVEARVGARGGARGAARLGAGPGSGVAVPGGAGDGERLEGIEAVIDKDLAAALLARELGADGLCILTDVEAVALDYGTDRQRWLSTVSVAEIRRHAADGQFRAGSMGPKVDAATRFVAAAGSPAMIGALGDAGAVLRGEHGTRIVPDETAEDAHA